MAFWDNIRFPYFNMQELNLDWIMRELKRIAGYMPQDGNVGDILTRKSEGAAWEPPEAVNININALPEDTEIGDNDQLVFYDISAQANRKIKPPNLLDSMMSNGTPLMDGTASPGTSKKPARYDHKHPTDTSRQAALTGTQMNAVNSGAPAGCFSSDKLKIDNGGTGADTAADARKNIGLCFAAGDSYEETIFIPICGTFLYNSTMYFTIVTPKSLENITSITVSKLTGTACGVAGAVESSSATTEWTTMAGVTLAAVKADGDHIRLTLTKTSAFTSGTAYTPVVLMATFKFDFA